MNGKCIALPSPTHIRHHWSTNYFMKSPEHISKPAVIKPPSNILNLMKRNLCVISDL